MSFGGGYSGFGAPPPGNFYGPSFGYRSPFGYGQMFGYGEGMNSRMALPPNQGPISALPADPAAESLLSLQQSRGLDPQVTPRPGILGGLSVGPVAPIAPIIPSISDVQSGPSLGAVLPSIAQVSGHLESVRPTQVQQPFSTHLTRRPRRGDYDAEGGAGEYRSDMNEWRRLQGYGGPQRDRQELAKIMLRDLGDYRRY